MENNLNNLVARCARYVGIVLAMLSFVVMIPATVHAVDWTITSTAGVNGSISPLGSTAVAEGSDQLYTISPDTGYHVDDVLVDALSVGAVTSYTFTNVIVDHTIEATFAIDQFIVTATAGDNGTISPLGAATVDYGNDLLFTITPDSGYEIADVVVDGLSVGTSTTTYTFPAVTANHTIDATFSAIGVPTTTHTVIASAGANGTITPSGTITVTDGSNQTFTLTPDSGYEIATLTIDGGTTTPTTTYTFPAVTANHTIDATFSAIGVPTTTHTVIASAGANGTITPSGTITVTDGSNQTFTLTPDSGYEIATLTIDGATTTPTTTYTFPAVTANHTIDATFSALAIHTIFASSGVNGSISPVGTTTVFETTNQTYTITPDFGYMIDVLTIDGVTTTPTTTVTFTDVVASHTIDATFKVEPRRGGGGSGGSSGSRSRNTVTATDEALLASLELRLLELKLAVTRLELEEVIARDRAIAQTQTNTVWVTSQLFTQTGGEEDSETEDEESTPSDSPEGMLNGAPTVFEIFSFEDEATSGASQNEIVPRTPEPDFSTEDEPLFEKFIRFTRGFFSGVFSLFGL